MALKFSTTRKPSPAQVKRLYQFAPWAMKRRGPDIARMIKNTPLFFTAWEGPELVGMARATTDFAFRAVLWDVIVDPGHARKGIGSRLVTGFLKHPRLRRVESFWLSTTDKQRFYAKFGFELRPKNIMARTQGKRGKA